MSSSRRSFLAASAAGAAAASALPASTYGRLLGANERVRMGLIGPGGMGRGHLNSFCGLRADGRADVDIVALADVCKPNLEKGLGILSGKQSGVEATGYRYHEDLVARDDVHAVLIASPEHWHAQHAIDCLEAGKDVYVEKPMTLDLDDALDLAKAAQRHSDRILQVGTQKMALAKYREAKRLVAENAIGKPVWSQTSYCRNSKDGEWNYYAINKDVVPGENLDWKRWCGPLGEREFDTLVYHRWRRYKDFSTGIIGDLLVHEMTPLLYAMPQVGWPTRVDAIGGHYIDKAMENFDQVNLTIQFENDHTMIVAGSTCNEIGLETMIRGHEGTMYLASNNPVVRPERLYSEDREEITVECERVRDHDHLRLNWLSCVQNREKPFSPLEMGLKIMVIVDLASRSMWEGRAFAFDPETKAVRAV